MALRLSWYADLKAETDLNRMAVIYEVTTIPFSKIDLRESQINGARLNDAIRHHKVEDYKQAFLNGDTFPRVIVHKTPTGHVILSGNQRCEAIRRLIEEGQLPKATDIEVYLVKTTDKMLLELIARTANVSHGEGDNKEERIQQAMFFVQQKGLAVKDASKYFVISETAIRQNIAADEQRARLQRAGIDAHRIPNTSLVPLSKLDYDESAQLKIGSLVCQHSPTSDRVKQVVATVAKEKSPQARTQKIKEFEKELSVAAHSANGRNGHVEVERSKVPLRPRRDKLISLLSRLVNFLESDNDGQAFSTLEELQVSLKSDIERVGQLCRKLRYRLGVLAK